MRKRVRALRAVTPVVANGQRRAERIWVKDLARHLNCQVSELKRLAKATNALHSCWAPQVGRNYFVYPEAAMRLIAGVRARQGEQMSRGLDPIKASLATLDYMRRKKAGNV